MMKKNIEEFANKIKELEVQYGLEIVSENPFVAVGILDRNSKTLYTSDGRLADDLDNLSED